MKCLKVRADLILHALSKRHHEDTWLTEVKTGSTMHTPAGELGRFDGLAVKKSWSKPCITGYEVKVDRQDFLRDEKWPMYRALCHRFYFACPVGLIAPEELADDVGLVTFNPDTGALRTAKKAVFRDVEISKDLLYYIAISRVDNDRHPYFSSHREALEAWVADKEERINLGRNVKSKLIRELMQSNEKVEPLERSLKHLEEQQKLLMSARTELAKYGIKLYPYSNWEAQLQQLLSSGVSEHIANGLKQLVDSAEKLRTSILGTG